MWKFQPMKINRVSGHSDRHTTKYTKRQPLKTSVPLPMPSSTVSAISLA